MFLHDEPGQIRFFDTEFFPSGLEEILANFQTGSTTSGSDTTRIVHTIDERKRKRMTSNRESARRSRWRKKRHLENLNSQLNQLRAENREAKNRLLLALQQCQLVERENDQLRFEALSLLTRLSGSYQILIAMQQQQQQLH